MDEKTLLSINYIQTLIEGKKVKEAGKILSGQECGNWCGIWYDWFIEDEDEGLPKEASRFVTFIKGLKGEWTKTHYIWLKNSCPFAGGLVTDIRISPIDDNVAEYNVGYSLGNKTEYWPREVFDTRGQKVESYKVRNNREAYSVVNQLFEENYKTLEDVFNELNEEIKHMKEVDYNDIEYEIVDQDNDVLFMGSDVLNTGLYNPEQLKNMQVLDYSLKGINFYVKIRFIESQLFEVKDNA